MAIKQTGHKSDVAQISNRHTFKVLFQGRPLPDQLDPVTLDKDNSILDQLRRTAGKHTGGADCLSCHVNNGGELVKEDPGLIGAW